ncbi:MAG: signal recognition particle protein [Planctomycetes bacterium]|nr:signal recognition particle protein [Planctomycetota bacterium]
MFESLTQRLTNSFSFFRGKRELTEENIGEGLTQVRQALLEADVHFQLAREFTDRVKARALGDQRLRGVEASDQFVHAVHTELVELMGPEDARLTFAKSGPTVILMAGLQGAGKTTTCAKLAKLLATKEGRRPLLVAADVKRPAAVQQLQILGERIGIPVFHKEGAKPTEVCLAGVAEAIRTGRDVVILDTAGRLHVDQELMDEVAQIAAVTHPHNQVLVVDAMTGQDAVQSAKAFHERLALTGVILTKMDGDARGGAAVSLKAVTGAPILYLGMGEKIDDLDRFQAERMAGRILGMGDVVGLVEQASEKINEEEAQAGFEKMVMGTFTLEDMLGMIRMVRKMGPMKKVLGMMPGMGQLSNMDVDESHMNRLVALFTSMTPTERIRPDVIDMSRRRRIARGAGQDVNAVNELLKRFKDMKKMMKQLGKMGMGSMLGAKGKREALAGMSPTGAMVDPKAGKRGMLPGLGGLGGLFGGGGGGGMPEGFPDLPAGFDPTAPRPMGSSATRGSGKSAEDRKKDKAKAKARRKNRKKR